MKQFVLPQLPYEPHEISSLITEKQLDCHYNQHHKKYIEKTNKLMQKDQIKMDSVVSFLSDDESGELFNQLAQAWNHTFYWYSISPRSQQVGPLLTKVIDQNGKDLEVLKDTFIEKGMAVFGSGWVWMVLNQKNQIEIIATRNAKNPLAIHCTPLIVCDVWEHAYYLDYQSGREEYLEKFWNCISWAWAEHILMNKNNIHHVEDLMHEKNVIDLMKQKEKKNA